MTIITKLIIIINRHGHDIQIVEVGKKLTEYILNIINNLLSYINM